MATFSKPQSVTTMLFAFLAFLQFTAAFQHGSHHSHARHSADDVVAAQLEDITHALASRQQQAGFTAITGVCEADTDNAGVCSGNRPSAARLEIRELQKNADQWNLYLLGMERFKAKDKNDKLSYYAVAGAQSSPYAPAQRQLLTRLRCSRPSFRHLEQLPHPSPEPGWFLPPLQHSVWFLAQALPGHLRAGLVPGCS